LQLLLEGRQLCEAAHRFQQRLRLLRHLDLPWQSEISAITTAKQNANTFLTKLLTPHDPMIKTNPKIQSSKLAKINPKPIQDSSIDLPAHSQVYPESSRCLCEPAWHEQMRYTIDLIMARCSRMEGITPRFNQSAQHA